VLEAMNADCGWITGSAGGGAELTSLR
jgi:hypothetical protein